MKRIIVLGGSGFFGHLIVERLRAAGMEPISASRSSGEMRIDANNPDDIRNNVKPRDLVVDAAGPFHQCIQWLGEPDGETLHPAAERPVSIGLDDQVQMVPLHAEFDLGRSAPANSRNTSSSAAGNACCGGSKRRSRRGG